MLRFVKLNDLRNDNISIFRSIGYIGWRVGRGLQSVDSGFPT